MILHKWLIIGSGGATRVVGTKPRMAANEVAVLLKLEIPDALFEKPTLIAELKVPDSAVPSKTITADVTDNIEKVIKDVTGLEMRISVVEPSKDEDDAG